MWGIVVLNGRGPSSNDSFTYIGTNGSSVVDYCLVPIEQWHVFRHFSVLPPLEVSHRFQISVDCSLPDHSILLWSIKLDCPHINTPKPTNPNSRQKFKIPLTYMQSELTSSKIQNIIDKINPKSIQKGYTDTCSLIISELIPYKTSKPNKCCHPWWNPSLNLLKQNLRQTQKAWLKQKGNAHLKLAYQSLQRMFDKAVKKAKAEHRKYKQIQLLHQAKHNSKEFWRSFKQLGIHSERKSIPNQVIDAEGEVVSEPNTLLQVWENYFSSLYNQQSLPATPNTLPCLPHTFTNIPHCQELNLPISLAEVELAISGLNPKKASGLDKIQGLHLNHPALVRLLHTLFSACFDSAIVPSEWCSALIHPILKPNTPDPRNPANYRGIALQSVVLKVLCKMLDFLTGLSQITSCQMSRMVLDLTVPVWTIFVICSVIGARK